MALAVRYGDRAVKHPAVEAVIGVGIIDDIDQLGSCETRRLQLSAVGGEGPIVLVADQDQERHGDVAVELRRAGRIVGDGGLQPARRKIIALLHRPHRRPAAMAVPDQTDVAPAHERLGVQEVERAGHVSHTHAAVDDVAAAADRLLAARPERIRGDDDIAPACQQLSPHVGMLADAAASVGQHDRREGPGTARPIEPARDLGTGRAGANRDAGETHGLRRHAAGKQHKEGNREEPDHAS